MDYSEFRRRDTDLFTKGIFYCYFTGIVLLTFSKKQLEQFERCGAGKLVQTCPISKPHWIEIELFDEEERPISNAAYHVLLPSGRDVFGSLDADGFARIDTIESGGRCKVSFPDLDQDAWQFIDSRAARS